MPKSKKHWTEVKRRGDDVCDDDGSMRGREGTKGRWENKLTSHHSPKIEPELRHAMCAGISGPFPFITNSHSSASRYQERGALEHPLSEMAFSLSFRFISFYLWQGKQTNNFAPWAMIKFESAPSLQGDARRSKKPLRNEREWLGASWVCSMWKLLKCLNVWNNFFQFNSALAAINWTS